MRRIKYQLNVFFVNVRKERWRYVYRQPQVAKQKQFHENYFTCYGL